MAKIKIILFFSFFILISHTLSEKIPISTDILTADESFEVSVKKKKEGLEIFIKINERSYIYSELLSLSEGNEKIHYEIIGNKLFVKDDFFGENYIYRKSIRLNINNIEKYVNKILELSYQGCLENIICYPKISKKLLINKSKNSSISYKIL